MHLLAPKTLLPLIPLALALGAAQAQIPANPAPANPVPANLGGTWTLTATASDGTVLQQTVTVRQFSQNGRQYLSAGGYTALLQGNVAGLSLSWRDADAVRTVQGSVRFAGNAAQGSAVLREAYAGGEVQTTRFALSGRR